TYEVRNTGNTVLTPVDIGDDVLGGIDNIFFPDNMQPGEVRYYTNTVTVFNSVTNIATAVGLPTDFKFRPLPIDPVEDTNDAIVVLVAPGYTVAKTLTAPLGRAAGVGETISFEITVANTSDVQLATVPLTDTFDATYLTYQSAIPPADVVLPGSLSWTNIGSVDIGASTSVVVNFTAVSSTLSLPETNTVLATHTTPPGFPGVPPRTNQAPYEISDPSFVLTKTLTSPFGRAAQVGESVVFTLSVSNNGDVALSTIPVEDLFDATYLSFVSAIPPADSNAVGQVNWDDIGPLPVGASTSIVATFTAVASTGSGLETNLVIASPTTPPTEPPVPPQTNEVPYDISSPGFTVVKTLTSPTGRAAAVGETVTFSLTVANTGDVDFVSLPLDDTFDATYLVYQSATPPADTSIAGALSWTDIGPLASGSSTSVVVNFIATASTFSLPETNTVVASPTVPPTEPPVPPQTNDEPYEISSPGYLVVKTLTSPSGRAAAVG
ncbi:MAG: DUF11 domain-containing protein, partial [Kiritimatiellae bacterium]|nr:DUF11 domain-containing protein [Kiritimatiellia bacterium]